MEPAESQQLLVSRLGSLTAQLTSQREPDAKTETELVSLLDDIATVLKDESHRANLGATKLPDTICALLNLLSTSSNIVNPDAALKEVGRVSANLVVQNDPNRNIMCALGYIDTVLSPATLGRGPRPCDHALVASLYNLVVEGNESCIAAMRLANNFRQLSISAEVYFLHILQPQPCTPEDANVCIWLWTVIQRSTSSNGIELASVLDEDTTSRLMAPIRQLASPLSSPNDFQQQETMLETLNLSCQIIEMVLSSSYSAGHQALLLPGQRLDVILDFIEHAEPSLHALVGGENGTGDGSEEDEELDPEQSMGDSKAYLAHGIVSVSSEMSDVADAAAFWARLGRWLASDIEKRKELVECALLGMGNSVKDDASAHRILSGDIVPFDCIMKMLRPETPATTQHALVGLLRNLSISVEGQKLLSTLDVGDKLVDMGVWDEKRDMLGSVQGGAIGIFKNLCKGQPATASHLIVCYKDQLLALLDRTNDQAIKFEGIRVFVNVARNLPKGLDLAGKQALQDQRIARLMVDMLSNAYEHPILQGEAILGLALLAVFGSAKAEVLKAMNETCPESPGKTGEQQLRNILLSGKDSLSEEIRQNGETLISLLSGQQKVE
ncbi:hypothetical protein I350_07358 [Cryptococcus amylolentus CBS 6273]|uniref:UNC-45/Cro1/She4 central domain-containing protein n=1 Tax=Cryptococcus amylolentus CBS 6273 TaxID=1296118 RepID=A0A1E3JEA7_9TREE|nr:hypothetical protein I350_07358 [Cryptococcus amylolentus CBS 6273]